MKQFKNKLDKITYILENYKHKLSLEEQRALRLQRKQLREVTPGVISTSDSYEAEKLVKKGLNVRLTKKGTDVVSTSTNKLMEQGISFSVEETKAIAREVGKSLSTALRESGEEISKMTIKSVEDNAFKLFTLFKTGIDKEYSFYIKEDLLYMQDDSFNKELIEVGVEPSGRAIVNKDVLKNEFLKHFKSLNEIEKLSEKELENYIFEAYYKTLKEAEGDLPAGIEEPAPEDAPVDAPPLQDATEKILEKFPTLKSALIKLMTKDFKDFISEIDWISPRPTSFRINLQNGQDFNLRWTGKGFTAQIKGKNYFINKVDEYQQALDKLSILYSEGPMSQEEEGAGVDFAPASEKKSSGGGGGGNFPGETPAGGGEETPPEFGGETPAPEGGEEAPKDLGGEEINFEEPEEAPKA